MRRVTVMLTAVLTAVVLGAAAAPAQAICRSGSDACVDRLIAEMQRNVHRLGCRHDAAFALLYERTTEGIRAALRSGAFSDRPLWNRVTTAFGRYYLDAAAAWRQGHRSRVPAAWRIAFAAARDKRVATLGDVLLGISAHVNRDLAYVYARFRVRSHPDHLVVNTVLSSVQLTVLPELIARFDPTLPLQTPRDPALSLDIPAWRELAWRNARRLRTAPSRAARQRVAGVREQVLVASALGRDLRLDRAREPRLDLAVADPARAIALLDLGDRRAVREGPQQRDQRARVGVLRPLRRRRVGDDPADLLAHVARLRHQRDGVAVGLAHLAPVEPGERRGPLGDERPRRSQHPGPVAAGELLREVDGDLQVLRLVGAHRHLVGIEREDVGGHEHGVAVQPRVHAVIGVATGRDVGRDRGLVRMGTVQQPLRGDVGQERGHAGDRRDPALAIDVDVRAVEAAGEHRGDEPSRALSQRRRIGPAVEGVEVGDEDVHLAGRIGRELGERPDRAGVVAEVELPGRLDPGQRPDRAGHDGHLLGRAPAAATGAFGRSPWARGGPAPLGVGPELRPV